MTFIQRILGIMLIAVLAILALPAAAQADGNLDAWPKDKVYVVDHTTAVWPVQTAAERMDDKSPLDLVNVTKCPSGRQCIHVYSNKSLPGSKDGETVYYYINGHDIIKARVDLDSYYNNRYMNSGDRLTLVMHEIGHAVGLDHSKYKSDVMHTYYNVAPQRLSARDLKQLNARY